MLMNRLNCFLMGIAFSAMTPLVAVGGAEITVRANPLFDPMTAMQAAMGALAPTLSGDASIGAVEFDPVRSEWHFTVDRPAAKLLPHALVTLEERTGRVCARDREAARGACAIRGDVSASLDNLRRQRVAMSKALAHPPPDLQGVMGALIRYQALNSRGYLHQNRMPVYVSMSWPDNRPPLDLSPDEIGKLGDVGMPLHPGSALPKHDPRAVDLGVMAMSVGLPVRRADGDYDVQYGAVCGSLCGSWWSAVLHHDATGWHVVSTQMNAIS
ncbi:hypothetical protein ISP17_15335 [Dyella ginsengisoli]|uniref:Uncharacterized protein n=1 Tax=Dyella ginsengisoli TaxID=363848 RepID=A0ABW8JYK1_9GAMM